MRFENHCILFLFTVCTMSLQFFSESGLCVVFCFLLLQCLETRGYIDNSTETMQYDMDVFTDNLGQGAVIVGIQ